MHKFPYFPLKDDTYTMAVGARPLDGAALIEIDPAAYYDELVLKWAQLAESPGRYVQALPGSEAIQWEMVELLLNDMARHYPQYFALEREAEHFRWRNTLLNTAHTLRVGDDTSLPYPALEWAGRQVQEDLLLLDAGQEGVPLVAGLLCFASGWELSDKLGQSFLHIHDPVPHFNANIGQPSLKLMERLKAERPVGRVNWTIKAFNQLNLPPSLSKALAPFKHSITAENAGERCYFRSERQTLSRLPRSNGVLFTIRTYQIRIDQLVKVPGWGPRLLSVLRSTPDETLNYKGMALFAEALVGWLECRTTEGAEATEAEARNALNKEHSHA
jgi:dimethylamine monooxygenase subunit A